MNGATCVDGVNSFRFVVKIESLTIVVIYLSEIHENRLLVKIIGQ